MRTGETKIGLQHVSVVPQVTGPGKAFATTRATRSGARDILSGVWQNRAMPPLFLVLAVLCLAFPREAGIIWLLLYGWVRWLRLR